MVIWPLMSGGHLARDTSSPRAIPPAQGGDVHSFSLPKNEYRIRSSRRALRPARRPVSGQAAVLHHCRLPRWSNRNRGLRHCAPGFGSASSWSPSRSPPPPSPRSPPPPPSSSSCRSSARAALSSWRGCSCSSRRPQIVEIVPPGAGRAPPLASAPMPTRRSARASSRVEARVPPSPMGRVRAGRCVVASSRRRVVASSRRRVASRRRVVASSLPSDPVRETIPPEFGGQNGKSPFCS